MPSISKFDVAVVDISSEPASRLPEYSHSFKPDSCACYVPSTPNTRFRIMVGNYSEQDVCVTVYVDGEWTYSGLSYLPDNNVIYFSGRLIDEKTIQEMRFVDLDTTCTSFSCRAANGR
jgi:hypothetical protein